MVSELNKYSWGYGEVPKLKLTIPFVKPYPVISPRPIIPKTPIHKFKVGDKVRFTRQVYGGRWTAVGATGIIEEIVDTQYFEISHDLEPKQGLLTYRLGDFELVEEGSKKVNKRKNLGKWSI